MKVNDKNVAGGCYCLVRQGQFGIPDLLLLLRLRKELGHSWALIKTDPSPLSQKKFKLILTLKETQSQSRLYEIPVITNLWNTESRPASSVRMLELSCECTFTPLFRAHNALPLTSILNLPLKTRPAFVGTRKTLLVESVCCPLRPFVRHYLAEAGNCWISHVWGWWRCCAHITGRNPRIILRIIIYY